MANLSEREVKGLAIVTAVVAVMGIASFAGYHAGIGGRKAADTAADTAFETTCKDAGGTWERVGTGPISYQDACILFRGRTH